MSSHFADILEQWESNRSPKSAWEPEFDRLDPTGDDIRTKGDGLAPLVGSLPKQPQATIDLHGMTKAEGLHELQTFITASTYRGLQLVLIVTGKGNHSQGEPVLRRAVRDFLSEHPAVGRVAHPARQLGGRGAFIAHLRSRTTP